MVAFLHLPMRNCNTQVRSPGLQRQACTRQRIERDSGPSGSGRAGG